MLGGNIKKKSNITRRRPVKILSVSDVVVPEIYREGNPEDLKDIDLVLGCGDLPPEYLSYLLHVTGGPLYYVRGNHDIRYDENPPMGGVNIHGRIMAFKGLKIMGLEGSRWYNGGPCQLTEKQMRKEIRRLWFPLWRSKGLDIIITHASPRHIHDAEDPCHQGFECFNPLINRCRPAYFIHGHIHRDFTDPEERITRVGNTKVMNTYGYQIISLDPAWRLL